MSSEDGVTGYLHQPKDPMVVLHTLKEQPCPAPSQGLSLRNAQARALSWCVGSSIREPGHPQESRVDLCATRSLRSADGMQLLGTGEELILRACLLSATGIVHVSEHFGLIVKDQGTTAHEWVSAHRSASLPTSPQSCHTVDRRDRRGPPGATSTGLHPQLAPALAGGGRVYK